MSSLISSFYNAYPYLIHLTSLTLIFSFTFLNYSFFLLSPFFPSTNLTLTPVIISNNTNSNLLFLYNFPLYPAHLIKFHISSLSYKISSQNSLPSPSP